MANTRRLLNARLFSANFADALERGEFSKSSVFFAPSFLPAPLCDPLSACADRSGEFPRLTAISRNDPCGFHWREIRDVYTLVSDPKRKWSERAIALASSKRIQFTCFYL